jgi:hypothetical protein
MRVCRHEILRFAGINTLIHVKPIAVARQMPAQALIWIIDQFAISREA